MEANIFFWLCQSSSIALFSHIHASKSSAHDVVATSTLPITHKNHFPPQTMSKIIPASANATFVLLTILGTPSPQHKQQMNKNVVTFLLIVVLLMMLPLMMLLLS